MKTTIPQRTIRVCDFCGREDTQDGRFKMEAQILIRRHALDILGDPAASGNQDFDGCDECAITICNQINIFAALKRTTP